jgi:hypothetical protein
MLLCFYCLMPYITMGLYTADKKFYLSDASSQLYRPGAYYLAKVGACAWRVYCRCTVYGGGGGGARRSCTGPGPTTWQRWGGGRMGGRRCSRAD